MRTRALAAAMVGAALLSATAALACGFCIEDRIAAVYDQAMVDHARGGRQAVAFFSIEGPDATDDKTQRAIVVALEKAGAAAGTVKLSLPQRACAIAYDPQRTAIDKVRAKADHALAARGLSLKALRIIDADGQLREPT